MIIHLSRGTRYPGREGCYDHGYSDALARKGKEERILQDLPRISDYVS